MIAPRHLMACGLIGVLASLSTATAQERPRIGYVFPAGGRQGTTFLVTIGGQFLGSWNGDYQIDVLQAHFSGGGIQATVRKDIRHLNSQETQVLQDKFEQLRKENSQDVATLKELFEVHKKLSRARSEFMRRETQPALADSVTVEITLAADAEPGRRELRVETPRGVSNPVAFYVGRLPEFIEQESEPTFEPEDFLEGSVRYPPRTETPITLPAVVNGQIIPREPYALYYSSERFTPGAADRFRFTARKGQQLVIAASGAGTHSVPARRGTGLVPGHFGAVRRQWKTGGLRRRLPISSRSRDVLPGSGGRTVRGRDQGRDLPRPPRFRLSHHSGRTPLHHQRLSAGCSSRGDCRCKTLRLEPADRHTDDRCSGDDAGAPPTCGDARGR